MPHRKNTKGDIGTAKRFSDSYDMDNIYLAEEGWVYRHFKNTDRTLWWDEIIVAGQVKPGMSIHGVPNGPGVGQGTGTPGVDEVILTNPPKLGTDKTPSFQQGDGVFDYRYSNHTGTDIDPSLDLTDPIFDGNQSGSTTLSIGTVTITGVSTFGTGSNESFNWSVSGGDFTKADLQHKWFIIDKSDSGSGMSGEAVMVVNDQENEILIDGQSLGAIKIGIEVTANATNSPIIETKSVTVV